MPLARRSIRLPDYDYAQPGAYFVTLVTYRREPVLARIVAGEIQLTNIGQIVQGEWFRSAEFRSFVHLVPAEFVFMPNHIHGIIWIVDGAKEGITSPSVEAQRRCAPTTGVPNTANASFHPAATRPDLSDSPHVTSASLGAIVRAFKSAVSYRVNAFHDTRDAPVWQRNYYEHILRSGADLNHARAYILENPLRWDLDRENPACCPP